MASNSFTTNDLSLDRNQNEPIRFISIAIDFINNPDGHYRNIAYILLDCGLEKALKYFILNSNDKAITDQPMLSRQSMGNNGNFYTALNFLRNYYGVIEDNYDKIRNCHIERNKIYHQPNHTQLSLPQLIGYSDLVKSVVEELFKIKLDKTVFPENDDEKIEKVELKEISLTIDGKTVIEGDVNVLKVMDIESKLTSAKEELEGLVRLAVLLYSPEMADPEFIETVNKIGKKSTTRAVRYFINILDLTTPEIEEPQFSHSEYLSAVIEKINNENFNNFEDIITPLYCILVEFSFRPGLIDVLKLINEYPINLLNEEKMYDKPKGTLTDDEITQYCIDQGEVLLKEVYSFIDVLNRGTSYTLLAKEYGEEDI